MGRARYSWCRRAGDGEGGSSGHGGDRADEDAEENGGLEGEVSREEVLNVEADQDAEGQWDADHREQAGGLLPVAIWIQKQSLECRSAGEDRGEGRGYAPVRPAG